MLSIKSKITFFVLLLLQIAYQFQLKYYFVRLLNHQSFEFYRFRLAAMSGDTTGVRIPLFSCKHLSICCCSDKLFSTNNCVRWNRCCSKSFISLCRKLVSSRSRSASALARLISVSISVYKLEGSMGTFLTVGVW